MEARLIDIILEVFGGNSDPLLIEDTFVTANETEHFSMISHQS